MSEDNYIKESRAWQKGHEATIGMLENQIAYGERDIEFTKKKLAADREQLEFVKKTYDDHIKEFNEYVSSKPKDPLFNTDTKGEVEVDIKDMRQKDKEQPKQ